ncbi:hypothetical protein ACGK9R_12690 [Halomonas sp. HNIBRBA4712]|uniref:hypothetical protein n=1 Tax=Halomonas sp. HNIBRBA4712 TaxID=3373087 RepID=UPI0037461E7D
MIMVKPVWDKNLGTGYLLNRVGLRKNVLMLAKLMDAPTLDAIIQRPSRATGREQSFTGRHQQKARYVCPAQFQLLGSFADPVEEIAGNIHRAAAGTLDRSAYDDMLKRCRIVS